MNMTKEAKMKFGEDVRNARFEKDVTQSACALHCGVSIVAFQNWERGICEPKPDRMDLICTFLGLNKEDYESTTHV